MLKNREQVTSNIDKRLWSSRIPDGGQRKTFAEVVRQEHITSGELKHLTSFHEGMEFRVEQIVMEWLKGSFVASVHDVEVIPHLQQKLLQEGFTQCKVRHMGGALVLLSSSNVEVLNSYVRVDAKRLSRWFADIRSWSHKEVVRVKVNDHIFPVMVVEEKGGTSVWPASVAKCEDQTPEGDVVKARQSLALEDSPLSTHWHGNSQNVLVVDRDFIYAHAHWEVDVVLGLFSSSIKVPSAGQNQWRLLGCPENAGCLAAILGTLDEAVMEEEEH
ncbi:hypothetical protein Ancab_017007 [Ancistrocladus abbreviatus]